LFDKITHYTPIEVPKSNPNPDNPVPTPACLPHNIDRRFLPPVNPTLKPTLRLSLSLLRLILIRSPPILHNLTPLILRRPRLLAADKSQCVICISLQVNSFADGLARHVDAGLVAAFFAGHAHVGLVFQGGARVRVDGSVPNLGFAGVGVLVVVFVDVDAAFVGGGRGGRSGSLARTSR
jgi:hypothetical protein